MSYLVLARKWRPQTFETITGQEHVTQTLTHAIEQDRVHHAFLFSGARGVGKTSAARVLARALNCETGATATPCGTCSACTEIASGTAIDVFEIDGASNRGIGEIRDLRDGVAYAPQRDRYKIYIIDEVHMLTTEAFNALLKTLEEPPAHVKFIFATTEPQKIPVTILSRCQRFDFKRIPVKIMTGRLEEILAEEGVTIDPSALSLVCRESEGSMRDALSLLDRIISFCGESATYDQVADILGVADRAWLAKLVGATLAHDAQTALAVVDEVVTYGVDLRQFSTDLVHYLRDIVVLQVAGAEGGLTDLADEERQALTDLGTDHSPEDLERLLALAIRSAERVVDAGFPRLELEMMAIRMSRLRPLRPLDDLVERLAAIERHLTSGAPLPPPGPGSGGQRPQTAAATNQAPAAPATPPPAPPTEEARAETPAPAPRLAVVEDSPPTEPAASPEPMAASAPSPTPPADGEQGAQDLLPAPDAFLQDDWERFVDTVRAEDAVLAASLDHGQVLSYTDGKLIVGSGRSTHSLDSVREARSAVFGLLQRHVGAMSGFDVEVVEQTQDTPFERRETRRVAKLEARREALAGHAAVTTMIGRFDGALCRVELIDEEEGQR